jgi:hypothetical protein
MRCNFSDHSAKARALMDALLALFEPTQVERRTATLQPGGVRNDCHR